MSTIVYGGLTRSVERDRQLAVQEGTAETPDQKLAKITQAVTALVPAEHSLRRRGGRNSCRAVPPVSTELAIGGSAFPSHGVGKLGVAMRGEALKGHLDMLLLAAIDAGATHGYAIAERLRAATDGAFDLADGTIYPALRRLEAGGYVKSAWKTIGGRERRAYRLTPKGARRLAEQRDDWKQFERGVRAVLSLRRV